MEWMDQTTSYLTKIVAFILLLDIGTCIGVLRSQYKMHLLLWVTV